MIDLESAPDKPLPRDVAFEMVRRSRGSITGGRPCDLTDEVAEEIAKSVAEGSFLNVAAGKAGVAADALQEWLRRGLADQQAGLDTIFGRLATVVAHAQQQAEASAVAALQRGGDGKYRDWRAQAWWLERRHKDRWSLPKEQASAGLTLQLSNEQLQALSEALRVGAATTVLPVTDVMSTAAASTEKDSAK